MGLDEASYQGGQIEVRRSNRRRRTVSAYREGDKTVVLIPAQMTRAEEQQWVDKMLARLAGQERKRRPDDGELSRRARDLSARYFDGRAQPSSVRWVANQQARWGSCTPVDGTIRISDRVRGMPEYVLDYVLLHELAHLLVPSHGPRFWERMSVYPKTERARGFLEGFASAGGSEAGDDAD